LPLGRGVWSDGLCQATNAAERTLTGATGTHGSEHPRNGHGSGSDSGASKHTARAGEDRAAHAAKSSANRPPDQTSGHRAARGSNYLIWVEHAARVEHANAASAILRIAHLPVALDRSVTLHNGAADNPPQVRPTDRCDARTGAFLGLSTVCP
jgi:hypothetical protein